MKKWIVAAVIVALFSVAAAGVALRTYKQNRPTKVWFPIPLRAEVPQERREAVAKELFEKLQNPALLERVARDTRFAASLELESDEEAAKVIGQRLFVTLGTAPPSMGFQVPSIDVGLHCKVKEFEAAKRVTARLMEDVRPILGVPDPQ